MKLITVMVLADLDDKENQQLDGTTIADHLDRIIKGRPEYPDSVELEFGTGDFIGKSTLLAISVVEAQEWEEK